MVGRPVTVTEVGVDALGPYTPRLPEPAPVVPSQSWYCVTPVPAVHVKVAADPERALLVLGAVIAGRVHIPVPLREMTAEGLVEELLVMVSAPVTAPAAWGSNCTLKLAACPGASVTGSERPDAVKPDPVSASALMVTDAVPEEVKVTVCTVGVLTATLPNVSVVALMVNLGVAAFSVSEAVFETLFAVAVKVTACAAVTDDAVAVKEALVAPAATLTVDGTVTEALLLERLTLSPPVAAAALRVTVQISVPAPVKDELVQVNALNAAVELPAAV